jgi:hypothetical protein
MSHRQEGGGTQAPGPGAQDWESPKRYPRATWAGTAASVQEVNASLEEAQAILAALVLWRASGRNAAFALADLLSRRGLERPSEALVAWAREA